MSDLEQKFYLSKDCKFAVGGSKVELELDFLTRVKDRSAYDLNAFLLDHKATICGFISQDGVDAMRGPVETMKQIKHKSVVNLNELGDEVKRVVFMVHQDPDTYISESNNQMITPQIKVHANDQEVFFKMPIKFKHKPVGAVVGELVNADGDWVFNAVFEQVERGIAGYKKKYEIENDLSEWF